MSSVLRAYLFTSLLRKERKDGGPNKNRKQLSQILKNRSSSKICVELNGKIDLNLLEICMVYFKRYCVVVFEGGILFSKKIAKEVILVMIIKSTKREH